MWKLIFFFSLLFITPPLIAAPKVATMTLLETSVQIIRGGRVLEVRSQATDLFNEDQLETGPAGKAKITFENGDTAFLGPSSTLEIHTEKTASVLKISLKLAGKLRALVNHRARRSFRVRTVNAVVGVKGTDFVTEYVDGKTRVGTLKGLVSLSSLQSGESVDVPRGKLGSVSVSGALLPLAEIAGDILEGVEIAGKQLNLNESAGQKIHP